MALNVSLLLPEDIIDHLGSGDEQWKPGRPAYEIAYSWYDAAGIPKSVQRVLASARSPATRSAARATATASRCASRG